jgi:hypothetical protein
MECTHGYGRRKKYSMGQYKKMSGRVARTSSLREDLISTITDMEIDDLNSLFLYVRCESIRSEWFGVDISVALPEDAIHSIASYLDTRSLRITCQGSDAVWIDRGSKCFPNCFVDGKRFEEMIAYPSWLQRYLEFSRHIGVSEKPNVMRRVDHKRSETCIPVYRKVSCTIPCEFSVSLRGSTFIQMTVSVHFSLDAVRSVVGLIQAPVIPGHEYSLECDRGLSRKYWGLAFGPLTGVVSSQGRYFDDFSTYRARHGLRDYLTCALSETVIVKVGIYIQDGKIAFYRLPESDYPDWECTGYVYDCFDTSDMAYLKLVSQAQVFPSVMFSHIGSDDHISVSIDRISTEPPYMPHVNTKALNPSCWSSFADDVSSIPQTLRVPPNSPDTTITPIGSDSDMDEFLD